MKFQCCDPSAPIDKCFFCGKVVHTCERESSVNNDYRCPLHKDDIQDGEGRWFCGNECYDAFYEE